MMFVRRASVPDRLRFLFQPLPDIRGHGVFELDVLFPQDFAQSRGRYVRQGGIQFFGDGRGRSSCLA